MDFKSINYLEKPLPSGELKQLLRRAGLRPQQIIRTKEPAYRQLVADQDLSDDELLQVMAAHPELIQRPLVVRGEKVVLARPVAQLAKLGIK